MRHFQSASKHTPVKDTNSATYGKSGHAATSGSHWFALPVIFQNTKQLNSLQNGSFVQLPTCHITVICQFGMFLVLSLKASQQGITLICYYPFQQCLLFTKQRSIYNTRRSAISYHLHVMSGNVFLCKLVCGSHKCITRTPNAQRQWNENRLY